MLELFRKYSRHWIIKVLLSAVIVTFIGFYGWGSVKEKMERYIAEVDEYPITREEYASAYQERLMFMKQQYKIDVTREMAKTLGLKENVLEGLIQQRLLLIEAQKMGIIVTDEEVQAQIVRIPAFHKDGKFSPQYYTRAVQQFGYTPSQFEENLRIQLILDRARSIVTDSVKVTNQQVYKEYFKLNQKAKLEIVEFDPVEFESRVEKDQEALKKYFEENKKVFKLPEEIKIKYISFNSEYFKDKMTVSDSEVNDYYMTYKNAYTQPEQIKARHILIKVDAKTAPPDVLQGKRKQIESIHREIKNGADFIEMAMKYSEDANAPSGGDLGFYKKGGGFAKPFEDAAFALEAGEVSDIVTTQFGFHIIKVEEKKEATTKEMDEVKDEIVDKLKIEKSKDYLRRAAYNAFSLALHENISIEQLAEKEELPLTESPFFTRKDGLATANRLPEFTQRVFSQKKGVVDGPAKIDDKYIVFSVVDHHAARDGEFKEVEDKVFSAWRKKESEKLALAEAEKHLDDYLNKKPLSEIAKKAKLEVKETGEFAFAGTYIPEIGNDPDVKQEIFLHNPENPRLDKYITVNNKHYLIHIKEMNKLSIEDYHEKDSIVSKTLLEEEKNKLLALWIEGLKKKSNIWINENLLGSM